MGGNSAGWLLVICVSSAPLRGGKMLAQYEAKTKHVVLLFYLLRAIVRLRGR